jgi:alanine-glyoxylate transaminase/serine-glyoxylate transaminase/serine-pyruvate transaminase
MQDDTPTHRIPGRPLYAAPGPTNIPHAVLEAVSRATTDFMAPNFQRLYDDCVDGLREILGAPTASLFFYAASGHGAWEATLANLLSPGERILMPHTGVFSGFWSSIAQSLGLDVQTLPADPRHGITMDALTEALREDTSHEIRAVCVVHNDTASGVTLPAAEIRAAIDAAGHPALYVLDVISSAASLPLHLDAWRVDAAIGSSQKGLMMLPGIAFTAVSKAGLAAHHKARLPRAYFDWTRMTTRPHAHSAGTVPSALFAGLHQSLALIQAETLPAVLARHIRLATAVRAAITAWRGAGQGANEGPELYCQSPTRASNSVSAILLPQGHTATRLRAIAATRYNLTLGGDLNHFADGLFRIGHMGDLNETMLLGILGATELALTQAAIPHRPGLAAALTALAH